MTKGNRFHACATCKHYQVIKLERGTVYRCSRLGYETKPHFKFNCWQPKENVLQLMKKEQRKTEEQP
ncbi:hypothetical protein AB685_02175 [Bacillus sp. LL01]|uniref:hypothetical protein n=1 Tax=Bacillus sp. LL01 TaxID=1665556 RepID=UPI00064D0F04|nr:hypothetical protein [Bacillus sp. LL01]KMJ60492.1 hypothetical protein AB685_02175 [Bacillus sp. LL01]